MLIIRRKRGESITISENIEIEILETSPNQVKLGIRAPRDISVLRKEIQMMRDLNRLAAVPASESANLLTLAGQYRALCGGASLDEEANDLAIATVVPSGNTPSSE